MTLQDQYTQINEGKGAKDVFLKHAKKLFPNMIPNHYGYEDSVKILKQRSVITENIWGIANASNKQPDWFQIFNENLNEYDKASNWDNESINEENKSLPIIKSVTYFGGGNYTVTLDDGYKILISGGNLEGIYGGDAEDVNSFVGQEWDQAPYNINEMEQNPEEDIDFDDENFSDSLIDDYDDMDRSNDDAYEKAFSSMNEAKTYTPSSQEVDVKSKSTKVAKEVETRYDKKYDNADTKKADNVIFDQLIRGVQFEMENPKNTDKTVEEIKNIVLKNLTKDPIWYTKNAMFGVKDLGYTNDIPGYRPSKSDQMIPVSKDKVKANVKDDKTENKKGMPKKVDQMTSTAKSSKGVQKMATPGKPKTIKPKN